MFKLITIFATLALAIYGDPFYGQNVGNDNRDPKPIVEKGGSYYDPNPNYRWGEKLRIPYVGYKKQPPPPRPSSYKLYPNRGGYENYRGPYNRRPNSSGGYDKNPISTNPVHDDVGDVKLSPPKRNPNREKYENYRGPYNRKPNRGGYDKDPVSTNPADVGDEKQSPPPSTPKAKPNREGYEIHRGPSNPTPNQGGYERIDYSDGGKAGSLEDLINQLNKLG